MSVPTDDPKPATKAPAPAVDLKSLEYPRMLHKAGGAYLRVENETEARAAVADGWHVDANEAMKAARDAATAAAAADVSRLQEMVEERAKKITALFRIKDHVQAVKPIVTDPPDDPDEPLMSLSAAAQGLDVDPMTLKRHWREGKVTLKKVGARYKMTPAEYRRLRGGNQYLKK